LRDIGLKQRQHERRGLLGHHKPALSARGEKSKAGHQENPPAQRNELVTEAMLPPMDIQFDRCENPR
jgi:hypothetical protein